MESTVHCTLYTVHFTLYVVHCTLYIVNCTLYTVHCIQHIAYCRLLNSHFTNQTAHCRIAEKHVSVSVEEAQYTAVGLTLLAAMEVTGGWVLVALDWRSQGFVKNWVFLTE